MTRHAATLSTEARAPVRSPASAAAGDLRLALAGGGTGGHIVPGLHLLETARACGPRIGDVVWFTSGRAIEDRVLERLESDAAGNAFERVRFALEPAGGGAPAKGALVWRAPRAVFLAREALVRHRSQVLLGLGGFTSLPAVIAARSLSIPVALLEINAVPGSATRWLSRFATRVYHAWRGSARAMNPSGAPSAQHRWIGPPLAPAFRAGVVPDSASGRARAAAARAQLGFDASKPLLVVLGGSQGSSALNRFVQQHGPALVASGIQVLHQTGPAKASEACAPFSGYRSVAYVDPVLTALSAATLVLTRGGASTLAEIAALRQPSIVVPYPHHADRHQEKNALELEGGTRIVQEEHLTTKLREEIVALCGPSGAGERESMSRALSAAVPLEGATRLCTELCELAAAAAVRGAASRA
ncbi:MAG: UDP-N-acetylglucosamine--N-acetylmuramyl-(pentapeptide) pyrophosphoryl-undecaprenol N-acetylglucosamine transferase [Planctomycetota bacterium]